MTHIGFTKNMRNYLIVSGVAIVAIIAGIFIRGVRLDIEFRGGAIITYSYTGELDISNFEGLVNRATSTEVSAQKSENVVTNQQTIIVSMAGNKNLSSDELVALNDALLAAYPENNLQSIEINNVDPSIGGEFLAKCLVAVAFASVLMALYVALRFRKIGGLSAGCMGVVALVHDVIIVFGVFVLFGIPLNSNFIAVVLTILGYSLNDTIVIYDRIRENEKLQPRNTNLAELTDLSINQSFRRTMMTSITTSMVMVVVTVVALIFNVNTIISFSFPLIIGLISGNYSSICLASPLWVKWQEYKSSKAAAGAA